MGVGAAPSSAGDQPRFWSDGDLLLKTSLYTRHYRDDSRHNDHQRMANPEWIAHPNYVPTWMDWGFARTERTRWLAGVAAFRNSFGQHSTYLYGGFRHEFARGEQASAYVKLTGGVLTATAASSATRSRSIASASHRPSCRRSAWTTGE